MFISLIQENTDIQRHPHPHTHKRAQKEHKNSMRPLDAFKHPLYYRHYAEALVTISALSLIKFKY